MILYNNSLTSLSIKVFFWLLAALCMICMCHATVNVAGKSSIEKKIDCFPLFGANQQSCEQLGCLWQPVNGSNTSNNYNLDYPKSNIREPWCTYPEDFVGYTIISKGTNRDRLVLKRNRPSGLPNDIELVQVDITEYNDVLRIKITDATRQRFEPAVPRLNLKSAYNQKASYKINLDEPSGILEVKRPESGELLFRTDLRKLIFSDRFHQINVDLSSEIVYGLGEHLDSFAKRADGYKAYSTFAMDRLPLPEGRRSYGSFPFLINLERDAQSGRFKNAHGLYLLNSNAIDTILQPDRSVTFRPIGGILDFFVFIGPKPLDVIQQYQKLVGLPDLPPQWALGFHLCRYKYDSIQQLQKVFERNRNAGYPFDVQWTDIDSMERGNDFTYDSNSFAGLPEFVENLHKLNMHYVPIFDPGLSQEAGYRPYERGVELDAFVKNSTNQILVGKVWNRSGRTVFPDFSSPKGIQLWVESFEDFHKQIKFDGAWIDMNEISNFVDGSLDGCPNQKPIPYSPGGIDLNFKTLCTDARHEAGLEYDIHNIYAFYEAIATWHALLKIRPNKRPFIISRSTSPGQGHFGGHWSGDIIANWDYLRWTIPSSIEHSMYGFNMMGHDICGFVGDTNEELCARWQSLGAFYTFSRNHNDDVSKEQDPAIMGPDVLEATRNSLTKRYSLLPLLYNLMHRAHHFGEPAIRSTGLEFLETDPEAISAELQFLWGDYLIVSPVVESGSFSKSTYLPTGRWYEMNVLPVPAGKIPIPKVIESKGTWHESHNISLRDIPIFFRAGKIIPVYRNVKQTVPETVEQPFGLDVFSDSDNAAHGELFVDDGETLDDPYNYLNLSLKDKRLLIEMIKQDSKKKVEFGQVIIYNLSYPVASIKVNGESIKFTQDQALVFDLQSRSVSIDKPLVVSLL